MILVGTHAHSLGVSYVRFEFPLVRELAQVFRTRIIEFNVKGYLRRRDNLLLDAEEVFSLQYTYGASTDGETGDTRFIVSRKGDEVQPALEAAMESKMTAELDELDDF